MRGDIEFKSEFRSDKLAVLIDAENTSTKVIESLLKEITKFGTSYVKRIYGDWTNQQMNAWKKVLNNCGLVPIQQFSYTQGKNATDSALIIDAMDLLYTDKFDGFCIVSSDSDFTRLAHRIRENGLAVYGFGKKTTPQAFKTACDRFISTDLLNSETENDQTSHKLINHATTPESTNLSDSSKISKAKLNQLLKDAYDSATGDENKKVNLGYLGQQLTRLDSSFDSRAYGYKKLGDLLKSTDLFIVKGNYAMLK